MPEPTYRPVGAAEADAVARFLSDSPWPFHVRGRLGLAEATGLVSRWDLGGPHTRAWWLDQDGRVHDGIGYALLREDWEQGTTTPVAWDDEPPR